MTSGYKSNSKNKELQAELGVWEKMSAQDVLNQVKKNEQSKKRKS